MALITYNIKTDFGAVGNGKKEVATVTIPTSGNPNRLTAVKATAFVSGDVGKWITVPNAGVYDVNVNPNAILETTITGFIDANTVTLATAATVAQTAVSRTVEWGTDDAAAFNTFNTTARGNQTANPTNTYQLNIPAGRYEFATQVGGSAFWSAGLKTLSVIGAGEATTILSECGVCTGGGFVLGSQDGLYSTQPTPGANTSRVKTVAAGSTTVDLVNLSELGNWTVGARALIGGVDLAHYGDPQTPGLWEYVRVTNAANVGGVGRITFTPALVNSYKETWPLYDAGTASFRDQGGPATLFRIHPDADIAVTFQDFTIDEQNRQVRCIGRDMTMTRITITGGAGIIMSQQENATWNNVTQATAIIEMDKCCGTVTMNNCSLYQLDFQTQCANVFNDNGSTYALSIVGSAVKTNLNGTIITGSLLCGAHAYGASQSITCTNVNVGTLGYFGVKEDIATTNYPITAGVIKVPIAHKSIAWAVPGAYCFLSGQYENVGLPFRIIDITSDASWTYIQTSLNITGWPALPADGSSHLPLHVHPAATITFSGCTGNNDIVDFSQVGARGKPLYSYSKRFYNTLIGNGQQVSMWGKIVSIKVNVTTPAAGTLRILSPFDNYSVIKMASNTSTFYAPTANLATPGEYVVPPPPEDYWMTGPMTPNCSGSSAVFSIEVITDQGMVAAAEATRDPIAGPLKFRIRG